MPETYHKLDPSKSLGSQILDNAYNDSINEKINLDTLRKDIINGFKQALVDMNHFEKEQGRPYFKDLEEQYEKDRS